MSDPYNDFGREIVASHEYGWYKVTGAVSGVWLPKAVDADGHQQIDIQAMPGGGVLLGDVREDPVTCSSGNVNAPAVNTAAIITKAAVAGLKHVITGIAWSYAGGLPTGGNLKVEDVAANIVFDIDITEEGPGFVPFNPPQKTAAAATALIITLAAAGAAVTGKVNILGYRTEA